MEISTRDIMELFREEVRTKSSLTIHNGHRKHYATEAPKDVELHPEIRAEVSNQSPFTRVEGRHGR